MCYMPITVTVRTIRSDVSFVVTCCLIPHKFIDARNDVEVGIWFPGFMKDEAKANDRH